MNKVATTIKNHGDYPTNSCGVGGGLRKLELTQNVNAARAARCQISHGEANVNLENDIAPHKI